MCELQGFKTKGGTGADKGQRQTWAGIYPTVFIDLIESVQEKLRFR